MVILDAFQWYLLAINVVAFIIYTIDFHIYAHGGDGIRPQVLCNLSTIAGGSLGTLIAELVWDPKINKRNAQSRVYTAVWLIIHVALVLALYGPNRDEVHRRVIEFYEEHMVLCWYVAVISLITFVVFAVDKAKAVLGRWRIRESVLLGLALAGGSVGALLAMDLCNHKVKKMHFMVGVPLMLCGHLALLVMVALGIF